MAERTEPTFGSVFTQALGKGLADYSIERQKAQDVGRENALMQYKMQMEQAKRQQDAQEAQLRMTQLRLRNQQINADMEKARIEGAETPEQKLERFRKEEEIKNINQLAQIREREQAQLQYSEKINKETYGGYSGDARNVYINAGGGMAGQQAVTDWLAYQRQMKENAAGAGPQLQSAQDQFLLGHGYASGGAGEKLLQDNAATQRKKNDDWNPFNNSDTTDIASPVSLLKGLGQVTPNVPTLGQPMAQPVVNVQQQAVNPNADKLARLERDYKEKRIDQKTYEAWKAYYGAK